MTTVDIKKPRGRSLTVMRAFPLVWILVNLASAVPTARAQTVPHGNISIPCGQCHSANSWKELLAPMRFDHSTTQFSLKGQHGAVECKACHKSLQFSGAAACIQCHPGGKFAGAPSQCVNCHMNDYTAASNPKHAHGFSTECATCHSTSAWVPATFDHNTAVFKLTGAHVSTPCTTCHRNGVYAGTPSACGNASCHLGTYNATKNPSHAGAGFPLDCVVCHSTAAWTPSSYNHTNCFPIAAGTNQASVDSQHRGRANYTYTPTSCYTCHPRGSG